MSKFNISKTDYNYAYRYMSDNYYSYQDEAPKLEDVRAHEISDQNSGTFTFVSVWLGRFARRFS